MQKLSLLVTVAALVERDGRFLMVEESPHDELVWNQPAGRVEPGESLEDAVVRETHEETGWHVRPESLVGIYQWSNALRGRSYVRFVFLCAPLERDPTPVLDVPVVRAEWRTYEELASGTMKLRSELVLPAVVDYLKGHRIDLSVLRSID
jgi:ADP-ribose pyrophosphatase YjhB (NUDIX family)